MAYNKYKNYKNWNTSNKPQQEGIVVTAKEASNNEDDQVIFISGIDPKDGEILVNEINENKDKYNCGGAFPIQRKFDKIGIHVKPSIFTTDFYKNGLFNKISFILANSNVKQYDGNDIATLYDQVESARFRIDGNAIADAASKGLQSAIDAWKIYSENMNNPEFIKMMKVCQMAIGASDSEYGHIYSVKNAAIAMAYAKKFNKDISFLKTKNDWFSEYNRLVNKTAKPIIMVGPSQSSIKGQDSSGKELTQPVIDDILTKHGFTDYVGRDWSQLPSQLRDVVNIDGKKQGYNGWSFFQYYDVSDTKLIPGKEDVFNDEIGLKNNLTGELNDIAQQRQIKLGGTKTEDEVISENEKNALECVEELCKKHNVIFSPNRNNPVVYNYGEGLYKLYRETFAKEKAIRDENRQKIAGAGVNITIIITGIGMRIINRYGEPMKVDDPELLSLMNNVWQTCGYILKRKSVNNNTLNENDGGFMGKEEFKRLFFNACVQLGIKRENIRKQNITQLNTNQNVEEPNRMVAESKSTKKVRISESQLKRIIKELLENK